MNGARLLPEKKRSSDRSFAQVQSLMAEVIMRPLLDDAMQQQVKGKNTKAIAQDLIKPSQSLNSFERLEIYNKQYWYRLHDCLEDDFPGLLAILGQKKFSTLCEAYLVNYPSTNFDLNALGNKLPQFIRDNPAYVAPYARMAYETASVELGEARAMSLAESPALRIDQQDKISAQDFVFKLQPHISVFNLNYEIDDFLTSFKRITPLNVVSNAHLSKPTARVRRTLPKAGKNCLVVHRSENIVYFKRISELQYWVLCPFLTGATLEAACTEVFKKAGGKSSPESLAAQLRKNFSEWSSWQFFIAAEPLRS
jgi:hypothetical protein